MNNLSLQQCQQLKGWGLTQEDCEFNYFCSPLPLGADESYERTIMIVHKTNERDSQDHNATIPFRTYWQFICGCPNLEQLLEFVTKDPHSTGWALGYIDQKFGYTATAMFDEGLYSMDDLDPKKAIYKLLEQVMADFPAVTDSPPQTEEKD